MVPLLEHEIDRKALKALRERFLAVNQQRLERVKAALTQRQQTTLSLLPLLLAVNHPLLPGYISTTTPAGFRAFTPTTEALLAARGIARSFSYQAPLKHHTPKLQGLFLMGSLGSLAHAGHSDMDLWLCYDPTLSEPEKSELARKCAAIEQWATAQGCEVHIFLINPEHFRQAQPSAELGTEHCGSTQHYLLLDEFYRTAIWLAGRTLLWWVVPAEMETCYEQYTQTLLGKRFIAQDEVLDLGSVGSIPVSEYVGAGLWQLLKGLHAPYKSVLKLLLIETYARQHPTVSCLALAYKAAIQNNECHLNALDPYLMLYRLLESSLLEQGDTQRLELVRRCLYFKAGKKLSIAANTPKSWQRLVLEQLTQEWGWDREQLMHVDAKRFWKIRAAQREQNALVSEMFYSYRFLTAFALKHNAQNGMNARDMKLLGRKLFAIFEHKAGKVECINPGIADDLSEPRLYFKFSPSRFNRAAHWAVFTEVDSNQAAPLKKAQNLIELIAWTYINGIYQRGTRLKVIGVSLAEDVLYRLFESLRNHLNNHSAPITDAAFLEPNTLLNSFIVVNLGDESFFAQPTTIDTPIMQLDQICINSWQECYTQHFSGPYALLDLICSVLNGLKPHATPVINVHCYAPKRAQAIRSQIKHVLEQALFLFNTAAPCRYLFELNDCFYLAHLQDGEVSYLVLSDRQALLGYLGHCPISQPALTLDPFVLRHDSLRLILEKAQKGTIQVFYQLIDGEAEITISDEHNSLWRQTQPFYDTSSLLRPIERFLRAVRFRLHVDQPLWAEPELSIEFYEIKSSQAGYHLEPRNPAAYTLRSGFYNVQAVLEAGEETPLLTIYCDQQRFSVLDHAHEIYTVVARYILAHRRSTEKYRCYLTDLDISALVSDTPTTATYLRYKTDIESALNQALYQL